MRYQLEKQKGQLLVVRDDGRTVAEIDKDLMGEKADVLIEGARWRFDKEFAGPLTATCAAAPGAPSVATRPKVLRQGWQVVCGPSTYALRPAGAFTSKIDLFHNGEQIGTSGRASFWVNRPFLEVPAALPVADAVFLLWIVFLMRRRAQAAASS